MACNSCEEADNLHLRTRMHGGNVQTDGHSPLYGNQNIVIKYLDMHHYNLERGSISHSFVYQC